MFDRVLVAFELAQDGRGRRAYVNYLKKRGAENGGNLSEAAMTALRMVGIWVTKRFGTSCWGC